jgi:hypothetical protein
MLTHEIVSQDVPSTEPANDRFAHIADSLRGEPGLQAGTGFSTDSGLRSDGKLFAMLRDGRLVVRLPGSRADELVGADAAARFYGVQNARLAQWVALSYSEPESWLVPANEALRYAREET